MLLMIEKGITGRVCHSIYPYAKAINKYMKEIHEKKRNRHILNVWMLTIIINNLYGWTIPQKFK